MQETDLRVNISNGEPSAFRFLFSEYYSPLCIYAMKYTKEKTSAEEIVHQTFVKLWERREHLDITDSIIGYLYKAVQNNALNYLKHLHVVNKYNEAYSEQLQSAENFFMVSQETGQSILLAKELESKILDAIETLPDQCKDIFKLSRFEGLKNRDIAERKGVSLNTVQKQISIALEKLRTSLSSYLPQIIQILLFINFLK